MPRYTSRTGKDVVLRFKGIVITVPAGGYYETSAGDLAKLFPEYIRIVEPDEIIKQTEPKISILHIQEIPDISPSQILIPTSLAVVTDQIAATPIAIPAIIPLDTPPVTPITTPIIHDSTPLEFKNFTLNPPTELPAPEIKDVPLPKEINEKITEIINNYDDDGDLGGFLRMIGEILQEK